MLDFLEDVAGTGDAQDLADHIWDHVYLEHPYLSMGVRIAIEQAVAEACGYKLDEDGDIVQ